jgi:hypothetical protein
VESCHLLHQEGCRKESGLINYKPSQKKGFWFQIAAEAKF